MNKMKFIDLFTVEYTSKYFGDITFHTDQYAEFIDVKYNGNDLWILYLECDINDVNKLRICLALIDKYLEIIQIVKEAIENHSQNNIEIIGSNDIKYIKTIINSTYPCLDFAVDKNENIYITISFFLTKEYPVEVFSVEMDQELNIKKLEYYKETLKDRKNGI